MPATSAFHNKVGKAISKVAEDLTEGDKVPSDELVLEEAIALSDQFDYAYDVVCERLAREVEQITTLKRKAGVYGRKGTKK